MTDDLYEKYAERLSICLVDGKQSEVNAEAIASLEYTSTALRMGISAEQRYIKARQFKKTGEI